MSQKDIIRELYEVIQERREKRPPNSYTTYLFEKGQDKILKKLGEEATEVIIAAKNGSRPELTAEVADLIYHLLVLLAWHGLHPDDVLAELSARRENK